MSMKYTLIFASVALMTNFCFALEETQPHLDKEPQGKVYIIPCEPVSLEEAKCENTSYISMVSEQGKTEESLSSQGSTTEKRKLGEDATSSSTQQSDTESNRTVTGSQKVKVDDSPETKSDESGNLDSKEKSKVISTTKTHSNANATLSSDNKSSTAMTGDTQRTTIRREGPLLHCTLKLHNNLDSDVWLKNVRFALRTPDRQIGDPVAVEDLLLSYGQEPYDCSFQFPLVNRAVYDQVEQTGLENIKIVFHSTTQIFVDTGEQEPVDIHRSIINSRNFRKWLFTIDTSGLNPQPTKESWYIPEGANIKQAFESAVSYNSRLKGTANTIFRMDDYCFEMQGKTLGLNDLEKTIPSDMAQVICRKLVNRTVTVELVMPSELDCSSIGVNGNSIDSTESFGKIRKFVVDDNDLNLSMEPAGTRFVGSSLSGENISFLIKGDKPVTITCSYGRPCIGMVRLLDSLDSPRLFLWENNPEYLNRTIATLDISSDPLFDIGVTTNVAVKDWETGYYIAYYHSWANYQFNRAQHILKRYSEGKGFFEEGKPSFRDIQKVFESYNSAAGWFKEESPYRKREDELLRDGGDAIISFLDEFRANLYYERGNLCFCYPDLTNSKHEHYKYGFAIENLLEAVELYQKVIDKNNGRDDEKIKKDLARVYGCLGDVYMALSESQEHYVNPNNEFYIRSDTNGVSRTGYDAKERWAYEAELSYKAAFKIDNTRIWFDKETIASNANYKAAVERDKEWERERKEKALKELEEHNRKAREEQERVNNEAKAKEERRKKEEAEARRNSKPDLRDRGGPHEPRGGFNR